eukprot:762640-Hanusia_phi.AAC.3
MDDCCACQYRTVLGYGTVPRARRGGGKGSGGTPGSVDSTMPRREPRAVESSKLDGPGESAKRVGDRLSGTALRLPRGGARYGQ